MCENVGGGHEANLFVIVLICVYISSLVSLEYSLTDGHMLLYFVQNAITGVRVDCFSFPLVFPIQTSAFRLSVDSNKTKIVQLKGQSTHHFSGSLCRPVKSDPEAEAPSYAGDLIKAFDIFRVVI